MSSYVCYDLNVWIFSKWIKFINDWLEFLYWITSIDMRRSDRSCGLQTVVHNYIGFTDQLCYLIEACKNGQNFAADSFKYILANTNGYIGIYISPKLW